MAIAKKTAPKSSKKSTATTTTRFALHSLGGRPVAWFEVEEVDLTTQGRTVANKRVGHHILVVDCSGSMWGKINKIREQLRAVVTIAEFKQSTLLFTLLSFSSSGDLRQHFCRVPATEIMQAGGERLHEIDSLSPRAMTGVSQGLAAAEKLVNDGEMTVITLLSDGYANDPSPLAEQRSIDALLTGSLKKHPNLVVNTVAHGSGTDFPTLSKIANACSGACIQSDDMTAKGFYQALHKTSKLLVGDVSPGLEIPGGANYVAFVSQSARLVLGAQNVLRVNGLSATDDRRAWRFIPVAESDYDKSNLPIISPRDHDDIAPILAFARTALAEGRISDAKQAVVSTLDEGLLARHSRALSAPEVQAFAEELESWLFDPNVQTRVTARKYGFDTSKPSALKVLSVLGQHTDKFTTDTAAIKAVYSKRGLTRYEGTREKGKSEVIPLAVCTEPVDAGSDLRIHSFDVNNANATVNMLTSQQVRLKNRETGKVIPSVEGVPLNELRSYRNYTIIGDGSLNMSVLPIRIYNKQLHAELTRLGLDIGPFAPGKTIDIRLDLLPIVDYEANFSLPRGTFSHMVDLTILSKALGAMFQGVAEAASYSPEQIEALKRVHISPKLYYNPSTVGEHPDSKVALAEGLIDVRPSYEIVLSSTSITGLGKLHSAKEAFQRRFVLLDKLSGKEIENATLDLLSPSAYKVEVKKLSKQTKLTAVDDAEFPIYAAILGLGSDAPLRSILASLGYDKKAIDIAVRVITKQVVGSNSISVMHDTLKDVNDKIEDIYDKGVRPIVFYIGASGLPPQSLGAVAYTADQLEARFPEVKLSKGEKESGMFFLTITGELISVYVTQVYFSLPKQTAA